MKNRSEIIINVKSHANVNPRSVQQVAPDLYSFQTLFNSSWYFTYLSNTLYTVYLCNVLQAHFCIVFIGFSATYASYLASIPTEINI